MKALKSNKEVGSMGVFWETCQPAVPCVSGGTPLSPCIQHLSSPNPYQDYTLKGCRDVHIGNCRRFNAHSVFNWGSPRIWQVLNAAPEPLRLHSSQECSGISSGGLTAPLTAFGIILPLGMWTWRKFFFSVRWWGGYQEKTLPCLSHLISHIWGKAKILPLLFQT